MILPIGHEDSQLRRRPWVTIAIMAICALALLATDPTGTGGAAQEPGTAPLEEAADYWRERPYLDAPPEVLSEVAYDVAPNQRKQYIGLLRSSADPPGDPAEVAAEQAELDAILGGERSTDGAVVAESPYQTWGLRPDDPTPRGFLTHMFMHAGWLHLLGNLFMLYLAGPALEDRWGRLLYSGFYLLSGVVSGGFFLAMTKGNLPLVGASGAIAGVLGAFLVRYARTQIKFLYVFFFGLRFFRGTFFAPAWAALPLWFGNEVLAAWIGSESGVAYSAHVGGFLFGVGAGLAIRQLRLEERFVDPGIEAKITVRGNPAVEEALQLREAGDLEGAFAKLQDETRRSPRDCDAALAYWATAAALGRTEAALPAFARTIKELAGTDAQAAVQCWLELCEHAPAARLDPLTLLALHKALDAQRLDEEAKRALRHAADPENPGLTPALALRVLEAARERDAQAAASAARVALASPHMPEEKKAKLRAQLAGFEAAAPPPSEALPIGARAPREPIDIGPLEQGPVEASPAPEALAADETEADPPDLCEVEPTLEDSELEALIATPRFQDVKLTEAIPTGLDERGVIVTLAEGKSGRVPFERIQGVAVAAVGGLAARPVAVIDLLLNWSSLEETTLRAVRLRSDRFDASRLAPGSAGPLEALRAFLTELLSHTSATPLPDPDAARAAPLRRFADLESYQREVLEVG